MSEWIPVTERMPDTYDEVLVTIIVENSNFKYGNSNFKGDKKRIVETAGWFSDGNGGGDWSSVWDEYRVAGVRTEVIAWMPLPKPWSGERREE